VTLVVTAESRKNKPSPWTNNICSVNDIFRFKSNVDGFAKQKKIGENLLKMVLLCLSAIFRLILLTKLQGYLSHLLHLL